MVFATLLFCLRSSLADDTVDMCVGVSYPNSVSYQVSVLVTPEYVDRHGSSHISAQLLYIGFGEVAIDIFVPDSCDCEADKVS